MNIIKFTANRTKNLKAIEINPEGEVILSGKNGQGKSNILNVIMATLTGLKLDDPILHGEDRAESFIDCGDFSVRKVWTERGERLEVLTKDGDKKSSPQTFLNGVVGKLSFDPLEFSKIKAVEQRDLLKSLVGLDFSDLEAEHQKTYEKRTVVNSNLKSADTQLKCMVDPGADIPIDEILFKDEFEKLNALRQKRTNYVTEVQRREDRREFLGEVVGEVEAIKIQIQRLQDELVEKEKEEALIEQEIKCITLPEEITEEQIAEAEKALEAVEAKNLDIRNAKKYRDLRKQKVAFEVESEDLTKKIEEIQQAKIDRIAAAKMPIEGLSMADDAVMYQGHKFSILSDGQKIRVSTAIGMALNPKLKVIFIRHGNDLDSEGKKEIFALAKEKGYQIWMEVVEESGEVGYFIEDGSNTKINGKSVTK